MKKYCIKGASYTLVFTLYLFQLVTSLIACFPAHCTTSALVYLTSYHRMTTFYIQAIIYKNDDCKTRVKRMVTSYVECGAFKC